MDKQKVKSIREEYPNAFTPWTKEQDAKLAELVGKREPVPTIAEELGRQPSAVIKRIQMLGLDAVKAAPDPTAESKTYLDAPAQYRRPF